MKKVIKIWDIILVAILGIFASGCNIIEPPPAEYGPEPEYGIPYSVQVPNDLHETQDQ